MNTPHPAPAPRESTALEARGVTFAYAHGKPVIKDFSADLRPGRLCAMIGPNASGKTTLLRIMLGHLQPSCGDVTVTGTSVRELTARKRANWLSYVPQQGGSGFAFTVYQVVAMGRHAARRDESAIESALCRCDLAGIRDRPFTQLSAGQQQRVLLARALAQVSGEGRVMLLDEPASAMDLQHLHRTMNLLVRTARDGPAVLAVLHDLDLAARYADDVWVLHEGNLVAQGPWRDVLAASVLEPVYGVKLQSFKPAGSDRPMFLVDPRP